VLPNGLKQEFKGPGEKPPHEFPLAGWDRFILGEEVHQGKEELEG